MNESLIHQLDLFFIQFKLRYYKKGEVILRPGDSPFGVYYIKKGFARLFSISKTGEELSLIIFKRGDFFPVMWAINDIPNEYFVDSMTSSELWLAPKRDFLAYIAHHPDVFMELTKRILVRLGGILRRMEYLVFGNAHAKVASILLICVERFGKKTTGGLIIQAPLTHNTIASMIGLTRETTSIELKKLERKGLVSYRGHLLFVKNLRGLKKESALFLEEGTDTVSTELVERFTTA